MAAKGAKDYDWAMIGILPYCSSRKYTGFQSGSGGALPRRRPLGTRCAPFRRTGLGRALLAFWHPALPLRHRHGYAAAFHRDLPSQADRPGQEFPVP